MKLGHNIMTSKGFVTSADRALETGADVYQIFYRQPQSYASFARSDTDIAELAERNKRYKKRMVIHGSYIINLCQDPTDYRHFKGVNILVEDLDVSVKLGAIGVIIHMGNDTLKKGLQTCKQNYITGVKEALRRSDPSSMLILETGAGVGNEVSSSLEELGQIRAGLTIAEQSRVKFCLDTCHMFAFGYRLDMLDAIFMLNLDIKQHIGWENVAVVHLNDSQDLCGSRKDNHADIGKGHIKFEGLMQFVHLCVVNKVPMVLETPTHFYDNTRFTAEKQMHLIRTYYDIMYDNLGPRIKIETKAQKKSELNKRIKQSTKVRDKKKTVRTKV